MLGKEECPRNPHSNWPEFWILAARESRQERVFYVLIYLFSVGHLGALIRIDVCLKRRKAAMNIGLVISSVFQRRLTYLNPVWLVACWPSSFKLVSLQIETSVMHSPISQVKILVSVWTPISFSHTFHLVPHILYQNMSRIWPLFTTFTIATPPVSATIMSHVMVRDWMLSLYY